MASISSTPTPNPASEIKAAPRGSVVSRSYQRAAPVRTPRPRREREVLAFTVAYRDKNGSFSKAADTWRRSLSCRAFQYSFKTIDDLARAFGYLGQNAKQADGEFFRGALFVHSGAAAEGDGELYAAPLRPSTLAEQRYREEVVGPSGLDVSTAGIAQINRFAKLPWKTGAVLNIFGCLSGGGPERAVSPIAEIFAKSQRVRTSGETGKAYFSREPGHYEPIQGDEESIYLRAFHIKQNLIIEVMQDHYEGFALHGDVMPQRWFYPSER